MVPGYSCEMEETDDDGEDAGSGSTRMAAVVENVTTVSSVSNISSLDADGVESLPVLGDGETVASFCVKVLIIFLKLIRRACVFGDEGGEDDSVGGEGGVLICSCSTSRLVTSLSPAADWAAGSGDSIAVVSMSDGSGCSRFLFRPFDRWSASADEQIDPR